VCVFKCVYERERVSEKDRECVFVRECLCVCEICVKKDNLRRDLRQRGRSTNPVIAYVI